MFIQNIRHDEGFTKKNISELIFPLFVRMRLFINPWIAVLI
jgi:hypothetical protein